VPFTPFHMGPGLAIKAMAGRHFSVLTFGIAQVAIDIEPLIGIVRGSAVLHGPTHTYLAALAIGAIVAVIAPPICRPILHRWNHELSIRSLDWLVEPETFGRVPVIAGAFGGTISHVAIDSIMHRDMSPLAPWATGNGWLGLISVGALHEVCVVAGVFGVIAWLAVGWRKRREAGKG
jgi:hypothetical protein